MICSGKENNHDQDTRGTNRAEGEKLSGSPVNNHCLVLQLISCLRFATHSLSRSSVEAEYKGLANVVFESYWLRNLLLELHFPIPQDTLVYCDNVSVIYLSGRKSHRREKTRERAAISSIKHFCPSLYSSLALANDDPRLANDELHRSPHEPFTLASRVARRSSPQRTTELA
ncbi:hypothetical protein MTR_2g095100 [Medicago truncatula]|uniref:RNA-directed DNA polymerase n=1 Tax=Medicago truncatula TaxID=3880 RepID=A0A072VCS2_MEDTR|nr:hypothetical protein MTR_2g095100 [Medicago truncatula]